LVLHQHSFLIAGVRLMTGQTIDGDRRLGLRIHYVDNRVLRGRMSHAVLERQNRDLVEVVLRQLHLAVKNRDQMLAFHCLWISVRTVALEAQRVGGARPQQVQVFAAMRFVTGSTSLLERRLVVHALLGEIGNVTVAAQADIHRIGLGKSRLPASVRAMATGAIARRSRMLHLCLLDELCLVGMASYAKRLGVGLCQHDFPILGRRVADFTLLVGEGRVHEFCHQLGSV